MNRKQAASVRALVQASLDEDCGWGGEDLTTNSTVPSDVMVEARFLAKATGVLAGLKVAELVFEMVDPRVTIVWTAKDGERVTKGTYFGTVKGSARSLLVGERIALNLMQRMSGVATLTRTMVDKVPADSPTRILDTRKTMPGFRVLDKQSVLMGGGTNHRHGLHDMVMIKDNHITAAGGLSEAVSRVHKYLATKGLTGKVQVEVETRTMDEVREALSIPGIDRLMLDNMVVLEDDGTVNTSMLREAVAIIAGRVDTEASGNVTLATVREIAQTHVTYISSGALTHSAVALDISLKIQMPANL